MKQPAIYIMANRRNGTTYVGATSNLIQRVWQHRNATCAGFAAKHHCTNLVYVELHADMPAAITREKQIKNKSRAGKLALIEADNPQWRDLFDTLL